MAALLDRLGLQVPIVQAGMGGGLATHRLAAAVSDAGGLGTIGFISPDGLRAEIAAARQITVGAVAVNLLLPFARHAHFEAASRADVVVTFWGRPRRRTARNWIHQCGSAAEALAARDAGADGVIAQGIESGGHVRGTVRAAELLAQVRDAVGPDYPVLSAGGICERADVAERLEAGAAAIVSGTRFLMSDESEAHAAYKQRVAAARETILTELFGGGWPAPHRVVSNAATERWLRGDVRGPAAIRLLNAATAPALARLPTKLHARFAAAQRPGRPLFSPLAPTAGGPANLVQAGPLYAGESAARITDIRPAGELVRALTP